MSVTRRGSACTRRTAPRWGPSSSTAEKRREIRTSTDSPTQHKQRAEKEGEKILRKKIFFLSSEKWNLSQGQVEKTEKKTCRTHTQKKKRQFEKKVFLFFSKTKQNEFFVMKKWNIEIQNIYIYVVSSKQLYNNNSDNPFSRKPNGFPTELFAILKPLELPKSSVGLQAIYTIYYILYIIYSRNSLFYF